MGCVNSVEDWTLTDGEQLGDKLTPEEIRIVKDTWEVVCSDRDRAGVLTFEKIFINHQDAKSVFSEISSKYQRSETTSHCVLTSSASDDGDDILRLTTTSVVADDYLITRHAQLVMETLGAAVECLDDSEFLSTLLNALGQIHAASDVKPYYLIRLWSTLSCVLGRVLQERFTDRVQHSWYTVFRFIVSNMRRGIQSERSRCTDSIGGSPVPDDTEW